MSDNELPPQVIQERWFKKVTVEPTMFLYMLAFMLTSVVEQAFFLDKACRVNHNYTKEICDGISTNDDLKKEVQITVSNFHQWNNIAGHVVPIILALFLGSWSDRRGRKLPLLLGLFGKLIYSVMIMVNASQDTWPVEYIIYTASIPGALTGADVAIFAAAFAYISDVSTVENRTIRVTILDVCYLSTMPIGVALGSYLFSKVVDRSYIIMFAINASCLAAAILYSTLHLKWKTNDKQRSITEVGCCGILPDFFDKEHVIQSVKTMTKRRPMNRRAYLWMFMIAMLFYTFQRDEKPMTYLYTQFKFNWDTQAYSDFKTFQSIAYVIFMLTGIPLMSKVLGFRDTTIAMIGATAHMLARVFFCVATVPLIFYVGGAISGLGPVVGPIIRSMTSKVVPQNERGKVFALLACCDNAVPFISGVLYTQVYNATVGQQPGIFYLTISTQLAVFVLVLIVHITARGRPLEVPEVDSTEKKLITNGDSNVPVVATEEKPKI